MCEASVTQDNSISVVKVGQIAIDTAVSADEAWDTAVDRCQRRALYDPSWSHVADADDDDEIAIATTNHLNKRERKRHSVQSYWSTSHLNCHQKNVRSSQMV